MPSVASRSTSLQATHAKATPQPVGMPAPGMPTPYPPYLGRRPVMISSLPVIGTTDDSAMRQFYGTGNLPARRVPR